MHAGFWYEFLRRRGEKPEKPKIGRFHFTSVLLLRRLLGAGVVASLLEMGERDAVKKYYRFLTEYSQEMSQDEREGLKKVILDELEHEKLFREEGRTFHTENIRDLVLGMNDGLVEVLATVAGLAGAYTNPLMVALGGLIVATAGTLSMAAGAYVSVKSQGEVVGGGLMRLRLMAEVMQDKLKEKLKRILYNRGVKEAETVSELISKEKEALYSMISKEEFGQEEVTEDPKKAAIYTGTFYILGGILPVLPFFFVGSTLVGLLSSLFMVSLALGIAGMLTAMVSGIAIKRKVIEMVVIGIGASLTTFLIGKLAGILLGIEIA